MEQKILTEAFRSAGGGIGRRLEGSGRPRRPICRKHLLFGPCVLDSRVAPALDCAMDLYVKASSVADALAVLAQASATGSTPVRILAGGTDAYPLESARAAWFGSGVSCALDIAGIAALKGIDETPKGFRIGALATWSDIMAQSLPPAFDGLKAAARQVGGVQIQNRGTIGGNLCNASPAADGAPPLLALDAEVEIAGPGGQRRLPLSAFLLGNRRTALQPGELLTAVHVPRPPRDETSVFLKLGARSYLVISIVSVAANLRLDRAGRISAARLAVGACSAAPLRLPRLEKALVGQRPGEAEALLEPGDGLAPIDDIRASAAYRRSAVGTLLTRAVRSLGASAREAA